MSAPDPALIAAVCKALSEAGVGAVAPPPAVQPDDFAELVDIINSVREQVEDLAFSARDATAPPQERTYTRSELRRSAVRSAFDIFDTLRHANREIERLRAKARVQKSAP